jgi:hypothetical protein
MHALHGMPVRPLMMEARTPPTRELLPPQLAFTTRAAASESLQSIRSRHPAWNLSSQSQGQLDHDLARSVAVVELVIISAFQ